MGKKKSKRGRGKKPAPRNSRRYEKAARGAGPARPVLDRLVPDQRVLDQRVPGGVVVHAGGEVRKA